MVILRAFPTELEADAAAQALLAGGIPCLIAADNCGGAFPPLEIYRGIQVLVRTGDLDPAREILTDFEAEKPEVDAETAERTGALTDVRGAATGVVPSGWSPSQKTWLGFLIGLGLGAAITAAVLGAADPASCDAYGGVMENDTDGEGAVDEKAAYDAFEQPTRTETITEPLPQPLR
jgi:hypothetical protein